MEVHIIFRLTFQKFNYFLILQQKKILSVFQKKLTDTENLGVNQKNGDLD